MARRRWKRWVLAGAGLLIALALALALTWEKWMPLGIKTILAFKGFKTESVTREGDRLLIKGLDGGVDGTSIRISSITAFTPKAWRQRLRAGSTNESPVFLLVDGWKITTTDSKNKNQRDRKPIYARIQEIEARLARLQTNLPRAQVLNGILNANGKEFRFGVIEWNAGILNADFTWPGLNDPASIKLDVSHLPAWQLIVRQIALEIGSRVRGNRTNDVATLEGYARWGTNRVDLVAEFRPGEFGPANETFFSEGVGLEGDLLKIPELERLDARFRLVVTNDRFDLRVSAPAAEGTEAPAAGE